MKTLKCLLLLALLFPAVFVFSSGRVLACIDGYEMTREEYQSYLAAEKRDADPARFREDIAFIALTDGLIGHADILDSTGRRVIVESAENRVLAAALKRHIAGGIEIPEKRLREAFFGNPENIHKPAKYRLYEIYLKFPPDADEASKKKVIRKLEEIREKAAAGEDFSRLASRYSESQTRLSGGYVGVVPAEKLPPVLGEAVSGLSAGEMTEVLRGSEGAVLLRCDLVVPEKNHTFEDMRDTVRKILLKRYLRRQWEEMEEKWRSRAAMEISCEVLMEASKDAAKNVPPVKWNGGRFSRAEAVALLAEKKIEVEKENCPQIRTFFSRLMTDEMAAEEARALKLDQGLRQEMLWAGKKALAGAVLEQLISARVTSPDQEAILEEIRTHPARYRQAPMYLLSVIRMDGDASELPSRWKRARKIVAELRAGQEDFSAAARKFSDHPSAARGGTLGWRGAGGMLEFGADSFQIISSMNPGEISEPLQNGTAVWIFRLEKVREARRMSPSEAQIPAGKRVLAVMRKKAGRDIQSEILASLEIEGEGKP